MPVDQKCASFVLFYCSNTIIEPEMTSQQKQKIRQLISDLCEKSGAKPRWADLPWEIWQPWFVGCKVPSDLKYYLSKCLLEKRIDSVRTLWTPSDFDESYEETGGLAEAIECGLVIIGSDEFDYTYELSTGKVSSHTPLQLRPSWRSNP